MDASARTRLIVTGKTNLPLRLLGLFSSTPTAVKGYTGWRWLPGSPFASDAWERLYVSGYAGHPEWGALQYKGTCDTATLHYGRSPFDEFP